MSFLERLQLTLPLVQAPMAGVATPLLAATVSEAGGLGSIGVGSTDAKGARAMIDEIRGRTVRAFNVNLFVHQAPLLDKACEAAWLEWLTPVFAEFGGEVPTGLRAPYKSLLDDPDMMAMLLEVAPPVVSFHFGLPGADALAALRTRGIYLVATATSVEEAALVEAAGVDAVVAQGIEAGGHRGVFNVDARDDALGTMALTRILVRRVGLPVIAAGGMMDGAGIAAALQLGAAAAQLGTAFIACPESAADDGYRAALAGPGAYHTVLTSLISGRPARALASRFSDMSENVGERRPPTTQLPTTPGRRCTPSPGGEASTASVRTGRGRVRHCSARCLQPYWSRHCERS